MVRKITLFLSFILLAQFSSGQGIEFFQGTWMEAMEKADKEDKILFVDAFAKWCGPCKKMSREVFTQEEVGKFFNKNFINLKLDMEEADGVTFGHKYPVSAYPTLFFLDGKGEVVRKVRGAQQADGLIGHAKSAIIDNDKSPHFAALYEDGNRDYETVYKYIKALNNAGKPSLKIANDYILSNPEISEEQLAIFLYEATTEADSRIFDLMLERKDIILTRIDHEEFKAKIVDACMVTVSKSVDYDASMLLDEALNKCKEALGKDAEVENIKFQMSYYADMGDPDTYFKYVEKLGKKANKDPELYKYAAEDLMERYKADKRALKLAREFSEKLCKKQLSAENAILHSLILIEFKEYDETINFVNESLEKIDKTDPLKSKLKSVIQYVQGLKKQQSINR
jgi:thiol-disulfide isomerase/thioredoxin